MPRSRKPEVAFRPPTREEEDSGSVLWCRECDRLWPLCLSVPSLGLCANHARAQWRAGNERQRVARWERMGLGEEEAEAMLEAQGNGCAICAGPIRLYGAPIARLDCWPGSEEPRGLLCFACRSGLDRFGDSPTLLARAAAYVERRDGEPPAPSRRAARGPRRVSRRTRRSRVVVTPGGREIDASDPALLQQLASDPALAAEIDALIAARTKRGRRR